MAKLCFAFMFILVLLFSAYPYIKYKNCTIADVTHIKEAAYQNVLEVTGVIESSDSLPVKLSYPVYIAKCHVKNNSYVNKGQLIVTLDTDKMEKSVKENDFTQYLGAGVSTDEWNFTGVSKEIYASESGYIRDLNVIDGDLVLSDENICTIESFENNQLKVTINQEDYSKVSVGDVIRFTTLLEPEKVYSAVVNNKTAAVRRESYLTGYKTVIDVYATINDSDEYLVSGLDVSGVISNVKKSILTLPFEYISQDQTGEFVYAYDKSRVEKVYILTGVETEDSAEILTEFDKNTLFVKNTSERKGNILLRYDF